ncbi:MAG: M24 family metallopeptidase [Pyrinomonadaceae bacterium]
MANEKAISDGSERRTLIASALQQSGLDAVVCALPTNVLMLSGYWPMVATSIALATSNGSIYLLVPRDEEKLTNRGWATADSFAAGSLYEIKSQNETIQEPLTSLISNIGLSHASIGYEAGVVCEPAPYVALHFYGSAIRDICQRRFPSLSLRPADLLLTKLRAVVTEEECGVMRTACRIVQEAFSLGREQLRPGLKETEVASAFREPLNRGGEHGITRADGFVFCMSGPNSADAFASYQVSTGRELRDGDLVLIHCNSYIDGYWTDITRTFSLGELQGQKRVMYDAILEARDAALNAVGPGVNAAEVDAVARNVLKKHGFINEFRHGLGHGVGFAAIDHNAQPRLHPQSPDVLEPGMTFNVEPAIYLEETGGIRHCDIVRVTEAGMELLTPFQSQTTELIVV